MIGQRFGNLVVLSEVGKDKHWHKLVLCRCDCGRKFSTRQRNILTGLTSRCVSCHDNRARLTPPHLPGVTPYRHTLPHSRRLRKIWEDMHRRCTDPKVNGYERYGGAGIAVCEKWKEFGNFLADMYATYQPGLTLDRIDNARGYEPTNCRWATHKQQQNNRRSVPRYAFGGTFLTLAEISEVTGITHGTLATRLRHGWSLEKTFTAPVDKRFSHT